MFKITFKLSRTKTMAFNKYKLGKKMTLNLSA